MSAVYVAAAVFYNPNAMHVVARWLNEQGIHVLREYQYEICKEMRRKVWVKTRRACSNLGIEMSSEL